MSFKHSFNHNASMFNSFKHGERRENIVEKNALPETTNRPRRSTRNSGMQRVSLSKQFSSVSLGARLELIENTTDFKEESVNLRQLYTVCIVLFLCFALVNCASYLVVTYGLEASSDDELTHRAEAIKKANTWYKDSLAEEDLLGDNPTPSPTRKCLDRRAFPTVTSVSKVETILQSMGLAGTESVRDRLSHLLEYPLPMEPTLHALSECIEESIVMQPLACNLLDTASPNQEFDEAIHVSLVLRALVKVLAVDLAALDDVIEIMTTNQRDAIEASYDKCYSRATAEKLMQDYDDAAETLRGVGMAQITNQQIPFRKHLQSNILKGVSTDLEAGHEENARVGMALAATVHFEPTIRGHRMSWLLSTEWVDSYMVWRIAVQEPPSSQDSILSSFLNSVAVCDALHQDFGEGFMAAQFTLEALSQMIIRNRDTADQCDYNQEQDTGKDALVENIGTLNFNNAQLSNPSSDTVTSMFGGLCAESRCSASYTSLWEPTNTVPTGKLEDEQFQVYVGIILWFTTLFAGLGLELITWTWFLHGGWTDERQSLWKFAQFSFPLLLATTLGLALHQNYLALICLVPGLWKFGFPETLVYMHTALYGTYVYSEGHAGRIQRCAEFLNAVGTIVHHAAAALVIAMLLVGVIPPSRHIMAPSLILVMQHWFVLLRYSNKFLYSIIEMTLEVFFEWTVLSEFEHLHAMHWCVPMATASMLTAHWLYLLAAFLETIKPLGLDHDEDDPHSRSGNSRSDGSSRRSEYTASRSVRFSGDIAPFSQQTSRKHQFSSMDSIGMQSIQEGDDSDSDSDSSRSEDVKSLIASADEPTEDPTDSRDISIDFRNSKFLDESWKSLQESLSLKEEPDNEAVFDDSDSREDSFTFVITGDDSNLTLDDDLGASDPPRESQSDTTSGGEEGSEESKEENTPFLDDLSFDV